VLAFGPVILAHLGLVGKYKTYTVNKIPAEPAKKGEKSSGPKSETITEESVDYEIALNAI
jgi:hypothetical protein